MTEQIDKNALKVQALTQRISELVAQYENQYADFRVEHTMVVTQNSETIESLNGRIMSLQSEIDVLKAGTEDVPQEEPATE